MVIMKALWDGLVTCDPYTLEVFPSIARSWEISEDGKTYTFKLSEDAEFHNGKKLTAKDFVYSWSRVADINTHSNWAELFKAIEGYDQCIRSRY